MRTIQALGRGSGSGLAGGVSRGFVNRIRIRCDFGDSDRANIVYFASYFRWFDRCTSALFRAAGLPLEDLLRTQRVLIPLVDVRARYILPSSYGDLLVVASSVIEWQRSSFVVHHRFLRQRALAAEGWETHVWTGPHPDEPGRMKGMPIPPDVKQKLSAKRSSPQRLPPSE